MFLKDHLKDIYNRALIENDFLLKEITLIKWVHRFGYNSLDELLCLKSDLKIESLKKK